ncbi:YesL family protein [Neobacillus sp. NPDC093127]|uniref:YesL family protein n=1 Tax=Neobacillus sp. NPDC093127 TaxID=3364296 RepID=UPI0038111E19
MNFLNSSLYQTLNTLSNFFLLSLLWLLMCLPIITIFPATAGLFAVVREWHTKKNTRLFSIFFRYFKENFKQSILLSLMWALCIVILYIDFLYTKQLPPTMKNIFLTILYTAGGLVAFTSIFIFPVMVQYKSNVIRLIKASFFLSIAFLPLTLICLLVLGLIIGAAYIFPISIFLTISLGAFIIYAICNNAFQKVYSKKDFS